MAHSYLIANPTSAPVKLTTTPERFVGSRRVVMLAEASAEAGGPASWVNAGCIVGVVGEPTGVGSLSLLQDGLQMTSRGVAQAIAIGNIP